LKKADRFIAVAMKQSAFLLKRYVYAPATPR